MKKILVASGQKIIDDTIKKFVDYEIVGSVEYKNEIKNKCVELTPDILLIGEGLSGNESLIQLLLEMVKDFPHLRIIYLTGFVDMRDEHKVNSLGILAMAGIYDIIHESKITVQMLKNVIDNPKTAESIAYLTKKVKDLTKGKSAGIEFEIPDNNNDDDDDDIFKNLYVVSSIKPGTGKSFLSTNIATAIASMGVEVDGKKPRVAIIEADLQNLSVGTLLQIEDGKHNLKTVMDKIRTVVNKNNLIGTEKQLDEVNSFIKECFKPYSHAKNLEALVGSQLLFNEMENIEAYQYVYLINAIAKDYDVIIVDMNSSLTHVTTFPLLHLAKTCYYVINLDFNNIRNNVRYQDFLKQIGIQEKVKYVLNEDIVNDINENQSCGLEFEDLIFTSEHLDDSSFKLEAKIPLLPKTVFLNRLYEGTPVVLDDKKYTLKARYELMKVSNQIWPIKGFKEIEEQVQNLKIKKKKGLFK